MKKAIAILVFCMYTLGLSGISVSYHYCGETFMYVELPSHKDKKGCRESCCGVKGNKKCCSDKQVKIKLKDHKQTISKFVLHVPCFDDIDRDIPVYAVQYKKERYAEVGNFHLRPPPLRMCGKPLYILHSVYRI